MYTNINLYMKYEQVELDGYVRDGLCYEITKHKEFFEFSIEFCYSILGQYCIFS